MADSKLKTAAAAGAEMKAAAADIQAAGTDIRTTADRGEELVDYEAPLLPGENRQDIFVAVNGESVVIKRGVHVQIKRKFYEVLMNAQEQEMCAYRAMETAKRQSGRALADL